MPEASFVGAFLGGVLTLLSPCGALLLPASLVFGVTSAPGQGASRDGRLAQRGALFLAGLATVLLPLGFGAALVGTLLVVHRSTSILVIGGLLVVFGVLQARGGARLAPRWLLQRRLTAYHLGLLYGVGGFCSGPLLGGVLTLAVGTAQPLLAAALLVFALGMALPLFAFAAAWQRLDTRWRWRSTWLRAHADLLGGLLLIGLGVAFVVFQGGSGLSGLYADVGITPLGTQLESKLAELLERIQSV